MKNFLTTLVAIVTLSLVSPAFGQEDNINKTIDQLQNKYDQMTSLSFDFFQQSGGDITGGIKTGQGNAKLAKIGTLNLMRWDYLKPEKQVLFSDGKLFSMYFENSKQMIVTPSSNLESDITYGVFTGKTKLVNDFTIVNIDTSTDKLTSSKAMKLIPKKQQSQIKDIIIWINENSIIERLEIRDHFDSITTLILSNIMIDQIEPISSSLNLFDFIPPSGTEIIRQ